MISLQGTLVCLILSRRFIHYVLSFIVKTFIGRRRKNNP